MYSRFTFPAKPYATAPDELAIELPVLEHPSANNAAAIQELLADKSGAMSTLLTYTFNSVTH